MLRFYSPFWFLLFLPLLLSILRRRREKRSAVVFSDVRPLRGIPRTLRQRLAFLPEICLYLGLSLAIVALARPQAGSEEHRVRSDGIAMVFCLDRSGSMRATDFSDTSEQRTRLDAAKRTFRDFVLGNDRLPGRPNDMIGLIAFGGFVDTFCPLTLDHAMLDTLLDQVQIPEVAVDPSTGRPLLPRFAEEENQTAIGDALVLAVERLRESDAKSKVIVFLSDGKQTTGVLTPEEGARIAETYGIKVYAIGIGSGDPVREEVVLPGGFRHSLTRQQEFDEATLKQIAEITGGQYFRAKNYRALEDVYAEIDRLETSSFETALYTHYSERYALVLLPALVLLLVYVFLRCDPFRTCP